MLDPYPKMVIEYDESMPAKMGGLYERYFEYPNGIITLTDRLNYYMQNCHLAEEIGHHETSYGDVISFYNKQFNVDSTRQELRARRFGHKVILPLEKLIECHKKGLRDEIYEMCLHLEIDRVHFNKAIEDYKAKFGLYVRYSGYLIQFEPLKIQEL